MLNVEDKRFIRCVNCWMLHTNNKSILDHWNKGACLFYCSICGIDFHDNIKDLQPHFQNEHGIKFDALNATRYSKKMVSPLSVQTMLTDQLLSDKKQVLGKKPILGKTPILDKKPILIKKQISDKKPVLTAQPSEKSPIQNKIAQPNKKAPTPDKMPEINAPLDLLDEYRCELCNRKFKHRRAYRVHYTLKHKHTELVANTQLSDAIIKTKIEKVDNEINPMNMIPISIPNLVHKKIVKKAKKRTNEAVMKTVIRKAPKKITVTMPTKKKPLQKLAEPITSIVDQSIVQPNTSDMTVPAVASVSSTVSESVHSSEVSQDQTVSSTYIPTPSVSHISDFDIIKPEPELIEEFSNNYVELGQCNGWSHMPSQYDSWTQNIIEPFESSPRLKVKDINDLQDPRQRHTQNYVPMESQCYAQNSVIMPSQNTSGLQIQNVQSYQTLAVQQQQQQLQPTHHQQYMDYSCPNTMIPSMNLPEHGMCTPNLYDMNIPQAQPVQNRQLINPIYLLPSNNPHVEYHY